MKISPSTQVTQQVAGGIGLMFSCFIVYSITVALIDEADIRFIAVAVGFIVSLTANPLAGQIKANQWRWVGWVVDVLLVVSFCYSAWWFLKLRKNCGLGFILELQRIYSLAHWVWWACLKQPVVPGAGLW